jgi:hypothetical protein
MQWSQLVTTLSLFEIPQLSGAILIHVTGLSEERLLFLLMGWTPLMDWPFPGINIEVS